MSPTWQVTCMQCGKEKWPTSPFRPMEYVCALCVSVGAVVGRKRREKGQRMLQTKKARPRGSQETTGGPTG